MTETFKVRGEQLTLLPEKAIYWKKKEILLIADLHIGKVAHFRKAGIAVPTDAIKANLETLSSLILSYNPKEIIFLGDLFHSDFNNEWLALNEMINSFKNIQFTLIKGNHDILPEKFYEYSNMKIHEHALDIKPFRFVHIPEAAESLYVISGHLHPGVKLRGLGRQSLRLPCFWFGKEMAVLPAFGAFTGLSIVKAEKEDRIFGIADLKVIDVSA